MQKQSYDRTYASSPSFKWQNENDILADGEIVVSWETYNTKSQKYLPFNLTRLVNNGTVDVWFYPNQNMNSPILIPSGTIMTIDRKSLPAVSSFKIVNASSTASLLANTFIVSNSREAQDTDSIVGRLHRRIFGGGRL